MEESTLRKFLLLVCIFSVWYYFTWVFPSPCLQPFSSYSNWIFGFSLLLKLPSALSEKDIITQQPWYPELFALISQWRSWAGWEEKMNSCIYAASVMMVKQGKYAIQRASVCLGCDKALSWGTLFLSFSPILADSLCAALRPLLHYTTKWWWIRQPIEQVKLYAQSCTRFFFYFVFS